MAWNDSPPTKSEIGSNESWASKPPSPAELNPDNSVVKALIEAGKAIDSYTGAPARSAIGAAQDGENPLSAFGAQFGNDPDLAPTGKDIALKAGLSDQRKTLMTPEDQQKFDEQFNPGLATARKNAGLVTPGSEQFSNADMAGVGIDVFADPTLAIPVGTIAKLGSKGIVAGAKMAGRGALAATEAGAKLVGAGRAFEVAQKTAKDTARATGEVLSSILSPRVAENFDELKAIAEKNGIDPSTLPASVEFGPNSFISRASRQRAEGVLGQPHLERFQEAHRQVQGAYNTKIQKISNGAPTGKYEAGQAIRESYDNAVDNFFDKIDVSHNFIVNSVPGMKLSPNAMDDLAKSLDSLENYGAGLAERGITASQRTQGKQLVDAAHAIRMTDGSYKQILQAQRLIGDAAFKTKNVLADIPPDVKRLRKLYSDIDVALVQTTRSKLGDEIADQLMDNNRIMSEFFGDKSSLGKILGNKDFSPDKLFDALVMNGDIQKLETLKKYLDPETLGQVKGAFLENLVKRDPDGAFTFGTLHSALRNKKELAARLFEPDEIAGVGEIIRLGDSFGPSVLSSSGTGASNVFRAIPEAIGSSLSNDYIIEGMKGRARGLKTKSGLRLDIPTTTNSAGPLLGPSAMSRPEAAAVGVKALSPQQENLETDPNEKLQIILQRLKNQAGKK